MMIVIMGGKQKNESTKERKEGIKDSTCLFMVFAAIVGESFIKNKSIQIEKKTKLKHRHGSVYSQSENNNKYYKITNA